MTLTLTTQHVLCLAQSQVTDYRSVLPHASGTPHAISTGGSAGSDHRPPGRRYRQSEARGPSGAEGRLILWTYATLQGCRDHPSARHSLAHASSILMGMPLFQIGLMPLKVNRSSKAALCTRAHAPHTVSAILVTRITRRNLIIISMVSIEIPYN